MAGPQASGWKLSGLKVRRNLLERANRRLPESSCAACTADAMRTTHRAVGPSETVVLTRAPVV